jgi:starvation-inducible DNA-binding protein
MHHGSRHGGQFRICARSKAELEKFQWFVRAHLENAGGQLANRGARTERGAATKAKQKAPVK